MNRQQLPHDPDPLEVEPEPVRRDRRQSEDPDLGFFAIIFAVLVLLAIVAAASLVGWDVPTTP